MSNEQHAKFYGQLSRPYQYQVVTDSLTGCVEALQRNREAMANAAGYSHERAGTHVCTLQLSPDVWAVFASQASLELFFQDKQHDTGLIIGSVVCITIKNFITLGDLK